MIKKIVFFITLISICFYAEAQHSVARKWNDALLEAIRMDFARPTVHARNLFHTSAAMYDAWAAFEGNADTYFLGKIVNGFYSPFAGMPIPEDKQAAQEEAISYACYNLLSHRFALSPSARETQEIFDNLMEELGYQTHNTSSNIEFSGVSGLGNYIAERILYYGEFDGSNERNGYSNKHYEPVNEPLYPVFSGNQSLTNPNRWQPLGFDLFIDQGGSIITGEVPKFLGAEWGQVYPFALKKADLTIYERNNNSYHVYHDPGNPPLIEENGHGLSEQYKWNFALVSKWSSHLDPSDGVMWDISPGASGNIGKIENIPTELSAYKNFYDELEGGDPGKGRNINPKTGLPYESNMVPRGDYTRVLAEFWADGPDSETPPGHWFTILNYVNDQSSLEKRLGGDGEILSDLEWDVKSYFMLGGAMHDCAITAWGIKGWYDYLRPISAIRFMADQGQSSNPDADNYSPMGIPLEPGYIEVVNPNDSLVQSNPANIGKIKVKAWRGPFYINNPLDDEAGVGWILAENWWPYQRPTFVTPPFAGYISGHSTFSRAAAEVLTLLTGDEYFPGGMGTFEARKNEFLVFEEGPSVDVTLQWATYNDASDQTSLSRIWGGIHPPADDLRGRIIGEQIARDAFSLANDYFNGKIVDGKNSESYSAFPNPARDQLKISGPFFIDDSITVSLVSLQGDLILKKIFEVKGNIFEMDLGFVKPGLYIVKIKGRRVYSSLRVVVTE